MTAADKIKRPAKKESKRIFYVYELREEDTGKVFYVGKGLGKRRKLHRSIAKQGVVKSHLYSKIQKLWREGRDYDAVEVFWTEDENAAFREEERRILFYGFENLANSTFGGEGPMGLRHSEESKRRMSETKIQSRPEGFKLAKFKTIEEHGLETLKKEGYFDRVFFSLICKDGPSPEADKIFRPVRGRCWDWIGRKNHKGVGTSHVKGLAVPAHRLSYLLHVGPLGEGEQVARACHNPLCVNPEHLVAGDASLVGAVRSSKLKIHPQRKPRKEVPYERRSRGEGRTFSILTDASVMASRHQYAQGERLSVIAKRYGVSKGIIQQAVGGKSWTHLPLVVEGPLIDRYTPKIKKLLEQGIAEEEICRSFWLLRGITKEVLRRISN